jgi:putative phosphoribosyl transferase
VVDCGRPEVVLNDEIVLACGMSEQDLAKATERLLAEIERRRSLYLDGRARVPVEGRTAIVVDDGIATGTTMRAALHATRRAEPARLILATPVAPPDTIERLRAETDEVVCLAMPEFFPAIGAFYRDLHQVSDDEVVELLRRALPAEQGGASHP